MQLTVMNSKYMKNQGKYFSMHCSYYLTPKALNTHKAPSVKN